jgi:lipopolysaccharide/colanic/teichoic acid biosynthesis glycosyltransferase
MVKNAAAIGPLVSGAHDPRVTRVGAFLRRTKLDELPQLLNVLVGEMTLIGPRAEVPRYVVHYTPRERTILSVRPGVTGPGAVYFSEHQADALDDAEDPERWYVEHQLHPKLAIDLEYLQKRGVRTDLRVVLSTVAVLLPRSTPETQSQTTPRAA